MKTLSISHSINRHGKVIYYQNGMPQPKLKRVAEGYNSWITLLFYRKSK